MVFVSLKRLLILLLHLPLLAVTATVFSHSGGAAPKAEREHNATALWSCDGLDEGEGQGKGLGGKQGVGECSMIIASLRPKIMEEMIDSMVAASGGEPDVMLAATPYGTFASINREHPYCGRSPYQSCLPNENVKPGCRSTYDRGCSPP